MPKFRPNPDIIIEARQLTLDRFYDVKHWCGGDVLYDQATMQILGLMIHTLEGDYNASMGDWIIQGVRGEFYACKPDIFEIKYREVT